MIFSKSDGKILLVILSVLLATSLVYTSQNSGVPTIQVENEDHKVTRIDLNRASLIELQQIPGIGPVLAKRILSARFMNGPFESPDKLLEIRGIGTKTMEKIRTYLGD